MENGKYEACSLHKLAYSPITFNWKHFCTNSSKPNRESRTWKKYCYRMEICQ